MSQRCSSVAPFFLLSHPVAATLPKQTLAVLSPLYPPLAFSPPQTIAKLVRKSGIAVPPILQKGDRERE